ncbi:SRPBCC family protein [Micromonospora sp. LAH09]|uniref:SRPBCC family protein n=1 Tax=Micromonospora cabrerizensis TaxID=2911213 RepID=UPI001EE8B9C6|nr:SRPBCC family protein [Micromonospora cabrerizensis]MCG5469355.1 SRPBCC family protein [Micromonospora cabrerizensis]
MNKLPDLTIDLPSDREVTLTRSFDAPRELVYAAHTQAEHLKHWWGRGNPLDVEIDFRVGGHYRCVEHAQDGNAYAFRGEYREIVVPERIVQTFEFEGMPGHVAVETLVFTEQDGRTTITSTTRFDTTAERDGMIDSGMTQGAAESYAALDRHLAALR